MINQLVFWPFILMSIPVGAAIVLLFWGMAELIVMAIKWLERIHGR